MKGDNPDFNLANVTVKQSGALSVDEDGLLLIHCHQNETEKPGFLFLFET